SPSPYAESPAPGSLMGRTRLTQLAALRARLQLALRSPGSASDDEQPDPARDRRSAGCRDQDSEEPGQLAARSVTCLDRPPYVPERASDVLGPARGGEQEPAERERAQTADDERDRQLPGPSRTDPSQPGLRGHVGRHPEHEEGKGDQDEHQQRDARRHDHRADRGEHEVLTEAAYVVVAAVVALDSGPVDREHPRDDNEEAVGERQRDRQGHPEPNGPGHRPPEADALPPCLRDDVVRHQEYGGQEREGAVEAITGTVGEGIPGPPAGR